MLGFHARGFANVFDRTHGHTPYDNADRVYSGALPPQIPAWVNASVPRFDRTPDADAELRKSSEPSGRLQIPAISIHTAYDPVVPVFHESLYGDLVAANGDPGMLDQRVIERCGHCQIFPNEVAHAVVDLQARATANLVALK